MLRWLSIAPFGIAGRARGVHDHRGVVGIAMASQRGVDGGRRAPALALASPRSPSLRRMTSGPARWHKPRMPFMSTQIVLSRSGRPPPRCVARRAPCRPVPDRRSDDDLRARVAHDVLQLGPGVGRIDPEAGASEHLRGEIGVEPLGRILAGNREPVARAESERIKPDRESGAHCLEIIFPCLVRRHILEVLFARRATRIA